EFKGLGLPNGTHFITIFPPGGFVATSPGGAGQSVTIIQGEVVDVTFTIAQVGPDAVDDVFTVRPDIPPLELPVLANDTDFSGDPLPMVGVTQGSSGRTVMRPSGGAGLTYQPAPGFVGTETFTYTVTDPDGNSDTATVTVIIDPNANRPPIAVDDMFTVQPNV